MNTQNYLYFDTTDNEWKQATLEQLATLNDPELLVCLLDDSGAPGPQQTYAEVQQQSSKPAVTQSEKIQQKQNPTLTAAAIPPPPPPPSEQANTIKLSPELEQIFIYTCRVINLSAALFFYAVIFIITYNMPAQQGLMVLGVGVFLHLIFHYNHFLKRPQIKKSK